MKSVRCILLLIVIILSCYNEHSVCDVEDPLEELDWLKQKVDSFPDNCVCNPSIVQGEYQGMTVFSIGPSSVYCDAGGFTLWNYKGEVVKDIRFSDDDWDPEVSLMEEPITIYTCE